MKTGISLALCTALVVATLGYTQQVGADTEGEFHATCPMSGGPAKKDCAVAYKGKQVYFCCENCPAGFEKDPKAVLSKIMLQWLETGQITQVGCPFSGKKAVAKLEVGSAEVGFCCENCKGKAEAAGDDVLALIFGPASKGFTLQTVCPVSQKKINTEKHVEHEGQLVYFCCDGCPAAFKADPAKFVSKLPQFAEEAE